MTHWPRDILPAKALEASILRFEAFLKRHRIALRPGSPLEAFTLSAFQAAYGRRQSANSYGSDIRLLYRQFLGLADLAQLLIDTERTKDFPAILGHLRLLESASPSLAVATPATDQATDKLLELFVGALAAHCGTHLELDDPNHSTGRNPDVLATIRGRVWGMACKTPHSNAPATLLANLEKGVQQIEASRAECGVVILALKNILRHDEFWPIRNPLEVAAGAEPLYGAYPTFKEASEGVLHAAETLGNSLLAVINQESLAGVFREKKALPGVLYWVHTACCVPVHGLPLATSVRFFNFQHLRPPTDDECAVMECLNRHAAAITWTSAV